MKAYDIDDLAHSQFKINQHHMVDFFNGFGWSYFCSSSEMFNHKDKSKPAFHLPNW